MHIHNIVICSRTYDMIIFKICQAIFYRNIISCTEIYKTIIVIYIKLRFFIYFNPFLVHFTFRITVQHGMKAVFHKIIYILPPGIFHGIMDFLRPTFFLIDDI